MLKKSAQFRIEEIRPKAKAPKLKRKGPRAQRASRSASDQTIEGATPSHNRSGRAGRKATYALEESKKRPTRKSTRASANRMKADSALIRRAENQVSSPGARAARGK